MGVPEAMYVKSVGSLPEGITQQSYRFSEEDVRPYTKKSLFHIMIQLQIKVWLSLTPEI